jgi:type IV pilus biogenesis protein CpaD/CtpE
MIRLFQRVGLTITACAALVACAQLDPYQKPFVWHPTGANQANLAAMVAQPHDLIAGRGATRTDSLAPVMAIDHVRSDTPKQLDDASSESDAGGATTGGSQSGGH